MDEQHAKTTLDGIHELTKWYDNIGEDYNGLHELLYKADKLAMLNGNLSLIVGDAHADYIEAKTEYKTTFSNRRVGLKSEYKAFAATIGRYKTMNDKHAIYLRLKGALDGIKPILDRMNQRISQLRAEWKNDSFIQAFEEHVNELQERINNLENPGNELT